LPTGRALPRLYPRHVRKGRPAATSMPAKIRLRSTRFSPSSPPFLSAAPEEGLRWEEPTAGPPLGRALRRAAMAPAPPGPPRWTPSCGRRSCHCALRKGHRRSIRCRSTRTACVVGAGQSGPARKAKPCFCEAFWGALGRTRTCDLLIRSQDTYVYSCL
jgi:hypothetical protein